MFLILGLTVLASSFEVHCNINDILKNNFEIHDVTEFAQCILNIVTKNHFSGVKIVSNENSELANSFHTSVLTEISNNIVKNGIPISHLDNAASAENDSYLFEENSITISNIETCESLMKITDVVFKGKENSKYLFILNESLMIECYNNFKNVASKIAEYPASFIYANKERNSFKIATYYNILEPKTCDFKSKTELIHLNTCRNGSIEEEIAEVFPNKKPKYWKNCPINVGLGSLFPYAKLNDKPFGIYDKVKRPEGSDVEILKIMAQYFNASLKFYHINNDAEHARLNWSFLKFVLNGSLDICAGGLYEVYGNVVAYSGIYSNQEIIWVYTVERDKGSWVDFVKRTDEIYIFIIFYMCYSIIWYIVCTFDRDAVSLSNVFVFAWGTLFGAASLHNARSIKQKILNFFYLILCIHLSAYINIELFPFLTIRGPPHEYKDTDELSVSGKPLYLIDWAKYFVEDEKYLAFANTSGSCISYDDCAVAILRTKGTTILLDALLAQLQVATAVDGEAQVLRATDPILVVYHKMLIRKDSLLKDRFLEVLRRLFEAGICDKLYEDAIGILVLDKARWASLNMMSNSYSCGGGCKITMSLCAGAFYAWILGCVISTCAFCAEIIVNRQIKNIA